MVNYSSDTDATQLLGDLVAHLYPGHIASETSISQLCSTQFFFSPHTGLRAKKAAGSCERTPVLVAANGQARHTNTTRTAHLFFYACEETTVNSFAG